MKVAEGCAHARRGPLRTKKVPGEGAWGSGLITFKFTKPHGSWEGTCRFHAKNLKTGCKKTLSIPAPGTEKENDETLARIQHWLNMHFHYDRQRRHVRWAPEVGEVPCFAVRLTQWPADPGIIRDDVELDLEFGETSDEDGDGGGGGPGPGGGGGGGAGGPGPGKKRKRAPAKAKAAPGKGKGKAKAKADPAPPAAAVGPDEPSSDEAGPDSTDDEEGPEPSPDEEGPDSSTDDEDGARQHG